MSHFNQMEDMQVKSNGGIIAAYGFILLLMAVGVWGWVWNIVKISGSDFADITGMLVLRCIGVFIAPLGAVLGFL